jgi:hypothetical protein
MMTIDGPRQLNVQDLNKDALKRSAAGMRFIAQSAIYNSGDLARLRAYIAENYDALALEEQPVGVWLAMFRLWRKTIGRLRVRQVIATDKHHVVVLMEGETTDKLYLQDLQVGEDYPHRILAFAQQPLEQSE